MLDWVGTVNHLRRVTNERVSDDRRQLLLVVLAAGGGPVLRSFLERDRMVSPVLGAERVQLEPNFTLAFRSLSNDRAVDGVDPQGIVAGRHRRLDPQGIVVAHPSTA